MYVVCCMETDRGRESRYLKEDTGIYRMYVCMYVCMYVYM